MDTPVPIPNTEVKHRSGEGIQLVGENSALPGFFFDNLSIKEKRYILIIFDSFLGLNEDFEFFNSIFVIFYFFEVFFFFLKIFILTFIVGCDKIYTLLIWGGMHMDIDKKNQYGSINITLDAVAAVAGNAATECYGVVGMSSKRSIKEEINELLKKENYSKGIIVKKNKEGLEVDVYIVVGYGLRITEIVSAVQKKVKYELERTFDIKFSAINVYVQGVKNI